MPMETCFVSLKARAVVALGNPARGDDGVAHRVLAGLSTPDGVDLLASLKTGLDLALALREYKEVLVVDADPSLPPGEIALFPLPEGEWRAFRHGLGLGEAVMALRRMGIAMPEVWCLAIGVPAGQPFQDGLSPKVAQAVPRAKEVVQAWLRS